MARTRSIDKEIRPYKSELGLPRLLKQLEPDGTRHRHSPAGKTPYPNWRNYSSQSHINDIAFDTRRRCFWLATWGGMLCWEPGTDSITRYTGSHGLVGNPVQQITVDNQGIVWAAGFPFGLSCLSPGKETACRPIPSLQSWSVYCLFPCPSGGIYAALRDKEERSVLGRLQAPGAEPELLLKNNLASQDINALIIDTKGILWIGNDWGLHRYETPANIQHFDLDGLRVLSLEPNPDGTLWVGGNHGLYRFPGDDASKPFRDDRWPRDTVYALAVNPGSGDLWCATSREIGKISRNSWQKVYDSQPDRVNVLLTAPDDHGKTIAWCGGAGGFFKQGDHKLEKAFHWSPEDSLSSAVQCLDIDDEGIWAGTARGLFHYSFETRDWTDYNAEYPGMFRDVRAILSMPDEKRVWIGSWNSGLRSLVQGIDIPDPRLPAEPLVALAAGKNGTLWAAAVDRVYWKKAGTPLWQPVPGALAGRPPKTMNAGVIRVICPQMVPTGKSAMEETLWVGTSNGLLRYRPDGPVNWDSPREWGAPKELEQTSIRALSLAPDNRLWIGAAGGLYCSHTWTRRMENDVRALAFTSRRTMWIGTAAGLEEWAIPKNGVKFTGEPKRRFTAADSGLAADIVTGLKIREIPGDRMREVWIGSPNGLSCFRCPITGTKTKKEKK